MSDLWVVILAVVLASCGPATTMTEEAPTEEAPLFVDGEPFYVQRGFRDSNDTVGFYEFTTPSGLHCVASEYLEGGLSCVGGHTAGADDE